MSTVSGKVSHQESGLGMETLTHRSPHQHRGDSLLALVMEAHRVVAYRKAIMAGIRPALPSGSLVSHQKSRLLPSGCVCQLEQRRDSRIRSTTQQLTPALRFNHASLTLLGLLPLPFPPSVHSFNQLHRRDLSSSSICSSWSTGDERSLQRSWKLHRNLSRYQLRRQSMRSLGKVQC